MSRKYDELAGRLTERLTTSAPRGRATRDPIDPVPRSDTGMRRDPALAPHQPSRTSPGWRTRTTAAVRRGHLVPADLHRRARREKLLRAPEGRITWTDVLVDGTTRLVEHPDLPSVLEQLPPAEGPRRLVQASLPADLDRRFSERHLDLDETSSRRVTYEELWAVAIELWLSQGGATRVTRPAAP